MTEFWLAVALMSALVLIAGWWFLRRHGLVVTDLATQETLNTRKQEIIQRETENLALYQQRVAELDSSFTQGEIDQDSHEDLTKEARLQLAVDIEQADHVDNVSVLSSKKSSKKSSAKSSERSSETSIKTPPDKAQGQTGIYIAIALVPLLALILYLPQGFSVGGSLDYQVAQQLQGLETISDQRERNTQLLQLSSLLEKNVPNNSRREDLLRLRADLYSAVNQHQRAADVYTALLKRNNEDAGLTAYLAQSTYLKEIAEQQNQTDQAPTFSPTVQALLAKALTLDPQQYLALSLSGMQAFSQADYHLAIKHWRAALAVYGANSPQAASLTGGIQAAEARLGTQTVKAGSTTTAAEVNPISTEANIRLKISIDQGLLSAEDNPDTPVFVFARAVNGPRMPLAAKRLRLADLPIELLITENDKMSVQSIAGHSQLIVGARLARSGQPIAASGDLQSSELLVEVAASPDAAALTELYINTLK